VFNKRPLTISTLELTVRTDRLLGGEVGLHQARLAQPVTVVHLHSYYLKIKHRKYRHYVTVVHFSVLFEKKQNGLL
jgi:hypothetical protein